MNETYICWKCAHEFKDKPNLQLEGNSGTYCEACGPIVLQEIIRVAVQRASQEHKDSQR